MVACCACSAVSQADLPCVGRAQPMRGRKGNSQFQKQSLGFPQFSRHATLIAVTQLDNLELQFADQEFRLQ